MSCHHGWMARKRTRLKLSPVAQTELECRLRAATHPRERERLQAILWATSGRHTLDDLARKIGRVRATIQVWLGKFSRGGVAGLIDRDTPPGLASPLSSARIQEQLAVGLKLGRWRSAEDIARWLNKAHGIRRARKSIYYWFKKNGWQAPGARNRRGRQAKNAR